MSSYPQLDYIRFYQMWYGLDNGSINRRTKYMIKVPDSLLLEFSERPYTNKNNEQVVWREALIKLDGKVCKVGVEKDALTQAMVSKSGVAEITLDTFGESLKPNVRLTGFKPDSK